MAAKHFRQTVEIKQAGRVERRPGEPVERIVEPVTFEADAGVGVRHRPSRSQVIGKRIESGMLARQGSDTPAAEHVGPHQAIDDRVNLSPSTIPDARQRPAFEAIVLT